MILHTNNTLGSFISHRAHRVNRAFLRTFRAHRRPLAYREHRAVKAIVDTNKVVINHYNQTSKTLSRKGYNVTCNDFYNLQQIRMLRIRIENMPFLPQEGRLQRARRTCSRMLKGLLLSVEGHGHDGRGTKIVYIFGLLFWREEDGRASSSCLERGDERKGTTCNPPSNHLS